MAALTFGLGVFLAGVGWSAPAAALAAGCEVLGGPADRVRCEARAEARSAARAEVERQLAGGPSAGAAGSGSAFGATDPARAATRGADWQAAVDEANAFDAGAILEPRPLAAVVGLAWFALVLRSRRRARARASA